jgi:RNA polymerase sigma-70 factor, ECF subfamily
MPTVVPLRADDAATLAADDGARWSRLMLLAQDGDGQAYQRLLTEIVPYLRALARRHLAHSPLHELEDAVQEVLLAVHGIRHTYERGRPFKPWLATIASRRLVDLYRRHSHRRRHEQAAMEDEIEFAASLDADGADPLHEAERDSAARRVRAAIDGLPPRQREALELLRLRELSLREASAASRQPEGSLKVAAHRALKSLRALLDKDT